MYTACNVCVFVCMYLQVHLLKKDKDFINK